LATGRPAAATAMRRREAEARRALRSARVSSPSVPIRPRRNPRARRCSIQDKGRVAANAYAVLRSGLEGDARAVDVHAESAGRSQDPIGIPPVDLARVIPCGVLTPTGTARHTLRRGPVVKLACRLARADLAPSTSSRSDREERGAYREEKDASHLFKLLAITARSLILGARGCAYHRSHVGMDFDRCALRARDGFLPLDRRSRFCGRCDPALGSRDRGAAAAHLLVDGLTARA
jgi:hypothetical protein